MNTSILKTTLATLLFMGLLTPLNRATANSLSGALGASAGATDFYRVTCSTSATNGATHHLTVSLVDLAPVAAPLISVQATKGVFGVSTVFAVNTTDTAEGEVPAVASPTGTPSGIVSGVKSTNSGNGVYTVTVNKSAAGAESYKLNYTCYTSANKLAGTAIATVQNQ